MSHILTTIGLFMLFSAMLVFMALCIVYLCYLIYIGSAATYSFYKKYGW